MWIWKNKKLEFEGLHYMIRKATFNDIEQVEDIYNEHFKHKIEYKTFTVFKKGIYPTRKDTEKAISVGCMKRGQYCR